MRNALTVAAECARDDAADQLRQAADALDDGHSIDEGREMIATAFMLIGESRGHRNAIEELSS